MAGEGQNMAGPRIQLNHFVSQPFPRVDDDDASCKYLPWNSPSLFGLLWMFFSQYLSQPSPPLVVGHHAFHYCLGKWNSLPSLHTVNRCLCDTCYSQRSYQIGCLFPCIFRIAYWKPHNNTNDFIKKKKEQPFYRKTDMLIPPLISLLSSWNFSAVVPR